MAQSKAEICLSAPWLLMPYLHEQDEEESAFRASSLHGGITLMASQKGAAWKELSQIQALQLLSPVSAKHRPR